MDRTITNRATQPMLPQSSAITADASATTRATAPTQDLQQPLVRPINVPPTMKTHLLAISSVPTLSPTLAKTHKIIQDTITKLSKLPPLINWMITHPTFHGPILTYLK